MCKLCYYTIHINRPAVKCLDFAQRCGEFPGCTAGRLIIAPTVFFLHLLNFVYILPGKVTMSAKKEAA